LGNFWSSGNCARAMEQGCFVGRLASIEFRANS
jgi:hypothetical protein